MVLATLIFFRGWRSPISRALALLCFETFMWQIGWLRGYFPTSEVERLLTVKVAYTFVLFLPATLYHFIANYLCLRSERFWVKLSYLICIIWLVILWTSDAFVGGYLEFDWGMYARAGAWHPAYLFFASVVFLRSLILARNAAFDNSVSATVRNKNRFVYGTYAFYLLAVVEYSINYGFPIYPIGVFFILTAFSILAYAIMRHRLLDVTVVAARTLVFALVYFVLLGIPLIGALYYHSVLERLFGALWWVAVYILCAILATGAHHANIYLQHKAEDRLLAEERRAHQALETISQNMLRFTKLKSLLRQIVHNLVKILQVKHAAIYLVAGEAGEYKRASAWLPPRRHSPLPQSLPGDFPLASHMTRKKLPLVREELRLSQQIKKGRFEPLAQSMDQIQASLVVPAFRQNRLLGFLALGDKRSGRIWTQADLSNLVLLANQAALAVENTQLHEAEEQRLIKEAVEQTAADIAQGVSHQFNNRLYVISVLASSPVLIMGEGDPNALSKEELIKWLGKMKESLLKIAHEAETGGQISRGIMSLAKADPYKFEPAELTPLIEQSIEFVKIKHSKEKVTLGRDLPSIVLEIPQGLPKISCNRAQVHDSFLNVIDNAIDAIRDKEQLIARGVMPAPDANFQPRICVRAESEDGWILVQIEDNGTGIDKQDIRKIFTPYWTTKATGQKGQTPGGHGLGLYFIKRIIEAHGGKILVESERGRYTRFSIRLPALKPGEESHTHGA
ncbi:MAG: GAF domain-containing protein [Candidatus Omnitrophica bacterium]|nr:GAF domain-containing protein [Candidatus Omnitrophota bacterium]